ncbi:translocon-associated protein subunit beta isoform X2 [Heterocephalus glaber]|uniref:Translocon-associated protein subunit beta isoform X2 n=1 Tax=Heterocephalus glaber TaxID=10181 RepID=A0AAX6S9K6_HETGA|nr:translocon-associated protein subunit beta isoform X2 [Heterocephalus glaber]
MYTMRLVAFVTMVLLAVTQAEEGARLLASKSLLNRYAVEGRDLTLQYNIYNVGSSAALDVELSDDSFPPEDFGIVSGMLNVKWDRIAPASNVSHTVVLRPLKAGYFNFTSATITYLAQEDGPVVNTPQDCFCLVLGRLIDAESESAATLGHSCLQCAPDRASPASQGGGMWSRLSPPRCSCGRGVHFQKPPLYFLVPLSACEIEGASFGKLALPVHLDRAGSWLSGSLIGDSPHTSWTGQPSEL